MRRGPGARWGGGGLLAGKAPPLGGGGGKGASRGGWRAEEWGRKALLGALALSAAGGVLGGLWARELLNRTPRGRVALREPLPEGLGGQAWDALDGRQRERWWVGRTEFDVPHRLIFTYSSNMLASRTPPHLYQNVLHTIAAYRKFWGEPDAPVDFLDNPACREVIERVEAQLAFGPEDGVSVEPGGKRLADHFDEEPVGMYKGDLCRVAALYETGGYYFDVDIDVIEPVAIPRGVGLVSVMEPGGAVLHTSENRIFTPSVFQAFIAIAPQHPVLRESMRLMYRQYQGTYDYVNDYHGCHNCNLGTKTFKDSLDAYVLANQAQIGWGHQLVKMLKEGALGEVPGYGDLPMVQGVGACQFFVFDPQERRAKFYSRIPGATTTCCPLEDSPTMKWAPAGCRENLKEIGGM